MKNRQYNIISELSKNLIHADEQIDAYDNFLSAWQYFVANQKKGGGNSKHKEYQSIEKFATSRISRLLEKNENSSSYTSSPLFKSLHNSAVICSSGGIIFDANKQAQNTYHLSKGMMLDSLNLKLNNGTSISTVLRKLLMGTAPKSPLLLSQFQQSNNDGSTRLIPVIIMHLQDNNASLPQALIIFMGEAATRKL